MSKRYKTKEELEKTEGVNFTEDGWAKKVGDYALYPSVFGVPFEQAQGIVCLYGNTRNLTWDNCWAEDWMLTEDTQMNSFKRYKTKGELENTEGVRFTDGGWALKNSGGKVLYPSVFGVSFEEAANMVAPEEEAVYTWNNDWAEDWMLKEIPIYTGTIEAFPDEAPSCITPEQYLKRFKEITEEMYEVTKRKNSDYTADSGDAYANFKVVENMDICSVEVGFLTRMTDKMARLAGLAKNKDCQVQDEKYTDTLQDLANYSILLLIYLENKK